LFSGLRGAYRRYVRRWLSQEALERVSAFKVKALALVGREPTAVPDPPVDSGELTLGGGLVYMTMFNVGDFRKNYRDMLTAFLTAFRDRSDVTLVIKLVTNPVRERHEAGVLKRDFEALGMAHRCRVVVIVEFLNESQMSELFRVTTFYVNTSHAEGACLPLMRSLAGGRPAVAPNHTAMGDYVDDQVAFVPRAHPEPAYWPHDPEQRLETSRHRLVWSDLRDAFLASAEAAERTPGRYAAMAATARARMAGYASRDAAERALRDALMLL
jgi:glycosyltransferase involved in cell wall biosynthesis